MIAKYLSEKIDLEKCKEELTLQIEGFAGEVVLFIEDDYSLQKVPVTFQELKILLQARELLEKACEVLGPLQNRKKTNNRHIEIYALNKKKTKEEK